MSIRSLIALGLAASLSASVLAQDPLLDKGKKKGDGGGQTSGGSSSGGPSGPAPAPKQSPPPVQSSGGQSSGGSRTSSSDRDIMREPTLRRQDGRNDNLINRQKSRSGTVQYGTSNNSIDRAKQQAPIVREAPADIRAGTLRNQVLREDRITTRPDIRVGYYQYDRGWRDDHFCYPYYAFDPYRSYVVISPWYYYPQLPPYISPLRVLFLGRTSTWSYGGYRYDWRRSGHYDQNDGNELDVALDDIVRAFEREDRRALDRVIPRSGQVNIYNDRLYSYTISAADFYDMMVDAVYSTRTRRYVVEDVRYMGDDVRMYARHETTDPWGRTISVYHSYRLERERGGYVIRDFSTSGTRGW